MVPGPFGLLLSVREYGMGQVHRVARGTVSLLSGISGTLMTLMDGDHSVSLSRATLRSKGLVCSVETSETGVD